jgi:hypothetical protein
MNFAYTPSVSEGNATMFRHSIFMRQTTEFGETQDRFQKRKLHAMKQGDTHLSLISSSF